MILFPATVRVTQIPGFSDSGALEFLKWEAGRAGFWESGILELLKSEPGMLGCWDFGISTAKWREHAIVPECPNARVCDEEC